MHGGRYQQLMAFALRGVWHTKRRLGLFVVRLPKSYAVRCSHTAYLRCIQTGIWSQVQVARIALTVVSGRGGACASSR